MEPGLQSLHNTFHDGHLREIQSQEIGRLICSVNKIIYLNFQYGIKSMLKGVF